MLVYVSKGHSNIEENRERNYAKQRKVKFCTVYWRFQSWETCMNETFWKRQNAYVCMPHDMCLSSNPLLKILETFKNADTVLGIVFVRII